MSSQQTYFPNSFSVLLYGDLNSRNVLLEVLQGFGKHKSQDVLAVFKDHLDWTMIKTKLSPFQHKFWPSICKLPILLVRIYKRALEREKLGQEFAIQQNPTVILLKEQEVPREWKQLLCLCWLAMVSHCWGFPKQMKCYSSRQAPSPAFSCWKYYKVRWKETCNPSSSQSGFTCLFRFPVCSKCSARESPSRLQECLTHIEKFLDVFRR